jgi:septal ring factor EnvC (AmiA/AmiB activator)
LSFGVSCTDTNKQSKSTETITQKQNDIPDEIQEQYIKRLRDINSQLQDEHRTLFTIRKGLSFDRHRVEDREAKSEAKIKELEKEKDNLKLDALKYYHGKMPGWLSENWKFQEDIYLAGMKAFNQESK